MTDWQTCNLVDESPPTSGFGHEDAGAVAEAPYRQGCHDTAMGTAGIPVVFGGSEGDIKGQSSYGGSYTTQTLSDSDGPCIHYDWGTHNNVKLTTYDDRN
jgi:hypothetical protein